jgi:hypothetical protein
VKGEIRLTCASDLPLAPHQDVPEAPEDRSLVLAEPAPAAEALQYPACQTRERQALQVHRARPLEVGEGQALPAELPELEGDDLAEVGGGEGKGPFRRAGGAEVGQEQRLARQQALACAARWSQNPSGGVVPSPIAHSREMSSSR